MSKVLIDKLAIRASPSLNAETVGNFNSGQIINGEKELILNEGRIWLKYKDESEQIRYVCVIEGNNSLNVEVPQNIPGPRKINFPIPENSSTNLSEVLRLTKFNDPRIRNWGDCFLCACVKGGLTTFDQCMDCFNWAMNTGKLRRSDCYINMNKEILAKEISEKYKTKYHEDYKFNANRSWWLTKNGEVIFSPQ